MQGPSETPLVGENSLAVAIAGSSITHDRGQRHVAFLYRHESKNLLLLHLGWHELVYYERWPAKHYSWLEIGGIDPEVQELFIDWVEIIAAAADDKTKPIPYSAIFRPAGNFDSSGHYIDKSDGSGLTCATFILAMFADYKMPLIDASSWPKRIEDFTWFRKIWKKLRTSFPELKITWIEQFKQRRNLKRFRPEEVVAAGSLYAGEPLAHDVVDKKVAQISASFPT